MKKLKYLLFLFTFLLIIDVNAATLQGINIDTPNFAVISSNYSSVPLTITNEDIYPNLSTWSYSYVINKYVYIVACSDMPSLGYSFTSFYNATTGNYATATNLRYTANLSSKTCLFSNGFTGKVVYLKFRLISDILNVPIGSSDATWLYNNYLTLNIGTSSPFSFTIQSIYSLDDDIDIYSSNFDTSVLEQQNQAIINGQNQNTQDIIDNQSQNTQDIIDNQNSNTDKEIESQQVCSGSSTINLYYHDFPSGYYLTSTGALSPDSTSSITDYIPIASNSNYQIINTGTTMNIASYCLYNSSKELISCEPYSRRSTVDFNSGNATYFRTTLSPNSSNPTKLIGVVCKNGNQALDDSINNINDNITNSNVDNPNSTFSNFSNMLPENGVITQLITLPISLFQKILTSLNSTCSNFSLGTLYNHELILPCINVSNYVGSTLWNVIDILFSGFFVLVIAKKMIATFENFSSMKEGDILD